MYKIFFFESDIIQSNLNLLEKIYIPCYHSCKYFTHYDDKRHHFCTSYNLKNNYPIPKYFLKNSTIKGIKDINYKKSKQKQTFYRSNNNKMKNANSSAYIPLFNNKKDLINLFCIKKY